MEAYLPALWHCPSRKPNLRSGIRFAVLRVLSLGCSFLNCFLIPHFLLLFPVRSWWDRKTDLSTELRKKAVLLSAFSWLSLHDASLLPVFHLTVLVSRWRPAESPCPPCRETPSLCIVGLTNTCLSKLYPDTDLSFSALQVYTWVCFFTVNRSVHML